MEARKHRIFTGPFAALEERFLAEVADLQKGDPLAPVPVLVGSNLLAAHLKGLVALRSGGAANLRCLTFLDLVQRLAGAAVRAESRPRLPHLGASVILEEILSSEPPRTFRAVAAFAGFRDAVLDTFRDVRDAGVPAEEFAAGIQRCIAAFPD